MARHNQRPVQQDIIPENFVEEHFLKTSGLYRKHDNLIINELRMGSAVRDFILSEIHEQGWPTKEVAEVREVQHSLPGQHDIINDTVTRITRVPMTEAEAAEYFRLKADELAGKSKKKTAKKAKTANSTKSKKATAK